MTAKLRSSIINPILLNLQLISSHYCLSLSVCKVKLSYSFPFYFFYIIFNSSKLKFEIFESSEKTYIHIFFISPNNRVCITSSVCLFLSPYDNLGFSFYKTYGYQFWRHMSYANKFCLRILEGNRIRTIILKMFIFEIYQFYHLPRFQSIKW